MRLEVALVEHARLMMAVLAASHWPEMEQAIETHAVHPHAKQTRQQVVAYASHPAVQWANEALAAGQTTETLFMVVLQPDLPAALSDFQTAGHLPEFWADHADLWQTAQGDLTTIFQSSPLPEFLARLGGQPLSQPILVMANLVYPALTAVLAPTPDALILLLPPPKAVGESPPWPYSEDPGWVQAMACRRLLKHHLADILAGLDETRQALLLHAATALYLEQAVDEGEAMAYLVRSKKQHKLPTLPLVVEEMRKYLGGENGRGLLSLLGQYLKV